MKIESYLLNTYDNYIKWHMTSIASLSKYFGNHDITFRIIDKNNFFIRKMMGQQVSHHPFLRKLIRIYNFLESDADVGIFIDLDTVVLQLEKDIRSLVSENKNYMHVKTIPFGLSDERRPWVEVKSKITECYLGDRANQEIINVDTGFAIYTRDFCQQFVDYCKLVDLDITTKSGLLHCMSINSSVAQTRASLASKDFGYQIINDEHLFSFFLHDKYKINDFIIEPPYNYAGKFPNNKICSATYNIGDPLYPTEIEFGDMHTWSMQKLCLHGCIFHHLLGWRMSRVLIPFYVEAFKK